MKIGSKVKIFILSANEKSKAFRIPKTGYIKKSLQGNDG
jgi:hypothetical protein